MTILESPTIDEDELKAALFLRGDQERKVWEYLLDDARIQETIDALTGFVCLVNNDLATRAATAATATSDEQLNEYYEWRRRALAFKGAVDRKLQSAKAISKNRNRAQAQERKQNERASLCELARAVFRHQQASRRADIRPEPHDEELWNFLDQLTVSLYEEQETLRYMVTEGPWL